MHKSILPLVAAIAFGSVHAAPEYFTFTGTIASVTSDIGGYAADHDIKAGNAVAFVFAVDTVRPAYSLDKGVRTEMHDTLDESQGIRMDFFFDSLLTPSLFSSAVTDGSSGRFMGYHGASGMGVGIHYGAGITAVFGDAAKETDLILYLPNPGETEFLPKLNDTLTATEYYLDTAATASAYLNLKCTAISSAKPSAIRGPARARAPSAVARMNGGLLIDARAHVFLATGRRAGAGR